MAHMHEWSSVVASVTDEEVNDDDEEVPEDLTTDQVYQLSQQYGGCCDNEDDDEEVERSNAQEEEEDDEEMEGSCTLEQQKESFATESPKKRMRSTARGAKNTPGTPSKQTTMTQLFHQKKESHDQKDESDSRDQMDRPNAKVFLYDEGVSKVFKTDELYTLKKLVQNVYRLVFKPQSFTWNKERLHKEAICGHHVFVPLDKTFIGPKETQKLLSKPEFKRLVKYNSLRKDDKFTKSGGRVRLRTLDRVTDSQGCDITYSLTFRIGPCPKRGNLDLAYLFSDSTKRFELSPDKSKPIVLELFAGCGGMSEGLKRAGFHVKYMVEIDPSAAATLRHNHTTKRTSSKPEPSEFVFEEDVGEFLEHAKNEVNSIYPRRGEIDHLHASPPCQGFSKANRNGGKNDEANNRQTFRFVEAVDYFQPNTASLENVTAMIEKENVHYLQEVVGRLVGLFYNVRIVFLDAADYGDPQNRKRVFLFASKNGYKLPLKPEPTHGTYPKKPKKTVREALQKYENIKPLSGSGWVKLDDGSCVTDHTIESTKSKAEPTKLDPDAQSCAVRCANALKHYSKNRDASTRERGNLQSFPPEYEFCGCMTSKNKQIGNAVPICLATAVGETIWKSYSTGNNTPRQLFVSGTPKATPPIAKGVTSRATR